LNFDGDYEEKEQDGSSYIGFGPKITLP